MATISSLGVGSGLDSEGIISALMAVERKPIDLLKTENTSLSSQVSSMGRLKSLTATMRDKAAALSDLSLWGKKSFTAADTSVVSGSVTSGTASGRYAVSVQALAASQTVTSSALASSASTLSEGSLTIELGEWTVPVGGPPATGFDPKSGASAITINIGAGETSLASIRDKINAAGAGVTATLINDAGGARLSLRSTETGAENGFRIAATETTDDGDSATGLSALNFDARNASNPLTRNQWAANAQATINGIQVESATNTFAEVSDGMSITVGKVSATAVEVVVADDTAAVKTGIDDFVKAFNELANYIKDQTKYDATAKKGGVLQGDRATVGFQWQLRGVINQGSSASSTWSRLSDIGISMKSDGTLETSSSKLSAALANPAELRKLLATDGNDTGSSGFMDRFRDLGRAVLDTEGSLQTRETALNASVTRNTDRQAELEERLTSVEARLRAQYEALDTTMAKLSAMSSYVTQQLSSLSSS
ncbi:flagellar filament capping protein FliD [Ideonella sp.]|uniref:flagellar filament capping protein FliD n=1 Tax=Ideonella sp. TaxID=1929293 RepID=UPI003BB7863A